MATTISNGNDVMSFLKMQHEQIKKMLERVTSSRGKERASAFVELRRGKEGERGTRASVGSRKRRPFEGLAMFQFCALDFAAVR